MVNQKSAEYTQRQSLMDCFFARIRENSTASVLFHTAVGQKLGLGVTDYKTLDVLIRKGPLTPKAIAEYTGLTSGSVTTLIDRLEAKGFAYRTRDEKDRRSIRVHARREREAEILPLIEPLGRRAAEVLTSYSDRELETICQFLKDGTAILHEEVKRL